jgi:hypothetical protein
MTVLWMAVVLKIPIAMLLTLVWWAAREPEPLAEPGDDGGNQRTDPHRGPRAPKPTRRGPHSSQPLPAPPRVRTVARGRSLTER